MIIEQVLPYIGYVLLRMVVDSRDRYGSVDVDDSWEHSTADNNNGRGL